MSETATEMRVTPESFWRDVWHEAECRSPCYHRDEWTQIEDGSWLRLYECVKCGTKVFAGLDAQRRVVHRPYPATPTEADR